MMPVRSVSVERIEGAEALARLEPEWWALWRDDPLATPFQSPAWLLPWAAVFQPRRSFALLLRHGGRPVALLPLFALPGRDGARLLLLGAGTTDWLGGPVVPRAGPDAPAPLFEALDAMPDWTELEFQQLPPDSPLADAPAPWPEIRDSGDPCLAVSPLPPAVSRSFAQNLRTARNRLARAGDWRIGRVTGPALHDAFDSLSALHAARWRLRGQKGVLADDGVRAFHRTALFGLEAAGLLRLTALELCGREVAMLYGLAAKGRHHCYLTAFDPAAAFFSPGAVLIDGAMREAAREGARIFDFLRGREDYKYAWGAVERPSVTRLFRRTGG